jgi:hypothetical protein
MPDLTPASRPLRRLGLIALAPLTLLAACENVFQQEERRPCPPVKLEAATSEMTLFRDGPGRDLTDVVMTAEITGYRGACLYDDDDGVIEVELQPRFAAALGPAARGRQQTLDYYIAIPRFIPDPAGKQVFTVALPFPDNIDRVRHVGEDVVLSIPLGQGDSALDYPIYVGLQLTPAQIEYNRTQGVGGIAR